jgi:hypothetical protein
MRKLLAALLASISLSMTCLAQQKDASQPVDAWAKDCCDGACNLTLIKTIRGARSNSDWFAFGLNVSAA